MNKKLVPKKASNKIAIFEDKEIRRILLDGEWYYVVDDVVFALTDSSNVKEYVKKLRQRDEELNKGWGQFVHPLNLNKRKVKQVHRSAGQF